MWGAKSASCLQIGSAHRIFGTPQACFALSLRWKPIVWQDAEHYPHWASYPSRDGPTPKQGSHLMLAEHPGREYVASTVEADTDPTLVWLTPTPARA